MNYFLFQLLRDGSVGFSDTAVVLIFIYLSMYLLSPHFLNSAVTLSSIQQLGVNPHAGQILGMSICALALFRSLHFFVCHGAAAGLIQIRN